MTRPLVRGHMKDRPHRRNPIFWTLAAAAFIALSRISQILAQDGLLLANEYDVINHVLSQAQIECVKRKRDVRLVRSTIDDLYPIEFYMQSNSEPLQKSLQKKWPDISAQTVDEFQSRSSTPAQIDAARLHAPCVKPISLEEIRAIEKEKKGVLTMASFYFDILEFSRVGFSRTSDQALIYFSYVCGPLCGSGNLVYLKKVSGRWQIVGHLNLWVS